MSTVQIFTVGGTIDKIYFDAKSNYEVGPPNITEVLSGLALNIDYRVDSLMQKDSLEMTDEDRAIVFNAVSQCHEQLIVITHGTDTMVDTAKVLSEIEDKTIVLTGALSPALFKNSDAMFNIGTALAAAQTKPSGVYIAMNGVIFDYDRVTKDVANNRFVAA